MAHFVTMRIFLIIIALLFTPPVFAQDTTDSAGKPTVLITGSNRGIGFEFVRQLAARDWRVIATTRSPEQASELAALAENDSNIRIETLDVTDDAEIAALKEKYTGEPIDVLLLNAAIGPTGLQPFAKLNMEDAQRYFAVNAIGPMQVAQAFYDNVKASKLKQIVVISSDSGSFGAGSKIPALWHYKASKAALNMYFHTLAFETKRRGVITVMLHPGMVATNPSTARLPGAMPTPDSVRQMLDVIDALTPEDNGRFIDYRGESMPW